MQILKKWTSATGYFWKSNCEEQNSSIAFHSSTEHWSFRRCDACRLSLHCCWSQAMLKRKWRSIASLVSAPTIQVAAEASRQRIRPYRLELAFALLTRKPVAARVLDLSTTAAKALGMMERGVVLVEADVL